ncbi:MAG: EamA family transporter [Rhizobacter sp.]|nr:EamA family transporter [Rhizobacter sp.]
MRPQTFLILLAGVFLNAGAQLLLKAGVRPLGAIGEAPGTLLPALATAFTRPPVLGGLACYVLSVALWLVALSRVDVSIAYPMLSLGYVVNAVAAWWLFGEAVGAARFGGIALILLGVLVVARS